MWRTHRTPRWQLALPLRMGRGAATGGQSHGGVNGTALRSRTHEDEHMMVHCGCGVTVLILCCSHNTHLFWALTGAQLVALRLCQCPVASRHSPARVIRSARAPVHSRSTRSSPPPPVTTLSLRGREPPRSALSSFSNVEVRALCDALVLLFVMPSYCLRASSRAQFSVTYVAELSVTYGLTGLVGIFGRSFPQR